MDLNLKNFQDTLYNTTTQGQMANQINAINASSATTDASNTLKKRAKPSWYENLKKVSGTTVRKRPIQTTPTPGSPEATLADIIGGSFQNTIDNKESSTTSETENTRLDSAKAGDTWYSGPINNTQMGLSLQNNINQQMAGQESNQLLSAKSAGAEALARKAQDIRGAAAQNSIMNGQLGQGMAQTGKMQAEMDTMTALGDYQTNMAQLAGEENQKAQDRALAALGLMQQDDALAETKRSSLVSEDLSSDRFNLDLITKAQEMNMPGYAGEGMNTLAKDQLSAEDFAKAQAQNKEFAEQEELMQSIRSTATNLDHSSFNEMMVQQSDGTWKFNGQTLTPSQALEVNSMMQNNPAYEYNNLVENRAFDDMTEAHFSKMSIDDLSRTKAGVRDTIAKIGGPESFDSEEEGGRPAAKEAYETAYRNTVYFNKNTGIYYRLKDASHDNKEHWYGDGFVVNMSGEALNGPQKGEIIPKVWTSTEYDQP